MIKYRFWLIFIVLVTLLALLFWMRPDIDSVALLIRNAAGETAVIPLSEIMLLNGIDFDSLNELEEVQVSIAAQNSVRIIQDWYERYRHDKGDALLKVFFIQQIVPLSGFEHIEYSLLTFESIDGARVVMQPQGHEEVIILLALEKERDKLSLRLITPEDSFSQRWLKNVVRISFR